LPNPQLNVRSGVIPEHSPQASALPRDHEVHNLAGGNEERKAVDYKADHCCPPPPTPRAGEDGETAEGKTEQRRHAHANREN
jgi:hypothetical protein